MKILKLELAFKRALIKEALHPKGSIATIVTHIKLMDEDGKYIKFAKHSPKLLAALSRMIVELQIEDGEMETL